MPAPDDPTWQISEPRQIDFEDPVTELHVRIVNGTVNVVGTDEPHTRVEIGEVHGPPLSVRREGERLVVAYEDLPWKGFLKWLDRKGWRRDVEVSVRVPSQARLSLGVVGASAVVSGVRGSTKIRGVSGASTLVGLTGPVTAETVSGNVETQRLTGSLRFHSVSGDLTYMDGGGTQIKADSVSGAMILDLRPGADTGDGTGTGTGEGDGTGTGTGPTDVKLSSVSGELAIRLPENPEDANVTVDARTTSGALSSAFPELKVTGNWGDQHATGVLGAGSGTLQASTLSGGLALLRRPYADPEDEPDSFTGPDGPADSNGPTAPDGPTETNGPTAPDGPANPDGPAAPTLEKDL
ncbi:DUF4097 family beta strand repeat-containing protein [Streptomyces iconiensis]|uniref:DUF4097 domain-containing protein n=1 Tax=Streptomyces iconiensis TaxID=1384038 RepID=A0ABT7A9Q8_9ACTN|nr:hypothetical protein [Streptomyces iconiensis]MDJ1138091.1 hypothetical protein [Streptomyces iconiensis]